MHIIEPLSVLFGVPHKAIPELMLPKGAVTLALAVQVECGYGLHVHKHARDRDGIARPEERVPVVRHQHISAESKTQAAARFVEARKDQGIFCFREGWKRPAEIHGNEENAVAQPEAMHPRHAL